MKRADLFALPALVLAGALHLWIAPEHFSHAPAHGLFFGMAGLLQLGWVMARLFKSGSAGLFEAGILLSGGMVILWVFATWVSTPFAEESQPLELITILCKLAEVAAFFALLNGKLEHLNLFSTGRILLLSLTSALTVWLAGLVLAPLLPGLAMSAGHNHAHGQSSANQAESLGPTSGYYPGTAARDNYPWELPPGVPKPFVPADNPMTPEKVELGRFLFYDKRLSGNGTFACASCHQQNRAFTDGLAQSTGSTGEIHPRNSQSLTNIAYYANLTWGNPTLTDLERQILIPMFGEFPKELAITGHGDEVLARFKEDAQYRQMFARAFPEQADPVNWESLIKAISSFTRSLVSFNSPYDRYVYFKDQNALSESAKRGMSLFLSEELECHHCHTGFNFSDSTRHINTGFVSTPFHNTGLYNLDGQGSYPRGNTGVFELTGKENDMGRFRAPSLRNVALTAPYMHDGSVATLQEVINLYAAGGRNITEGEFAGDGRRNPHKSGFVSGFNISDQSKADLVAFLESLTDERFIQNPRFSDPFSSGKKTTNRANFAGLLESNTPGWLRNIFLSTGILR